MNARVPVIVPPAPDELLSFWISRHAAFFGVTPQTMLHHCLPETTSLREVDMHLTIDQSRRFANMLSIDAKTVRATTFNVTTKPTHPLIAKGNTPISGAQIELARLMLIRRISWPLPREKDLWRYRILGVLIPEFGAILAKLGSGPIGVSGNRVGTATADAVDIKNKKSEAFHKYQNLETTAVLMLTAPSRSRSCIFAKPDS